jgi:hypothetical protein
MKKFNYLNFKKLLVPFLGFAALLWFLVRVIPKPSRANYPCMRAAAPLASSFVIYIAGLFATAFIFTKARSFFQKSKYLLFVGAAVLGIIVSFVTMSNHNQAKANLMSTPPDGPNNPMGTGVGIKPGRVAWIFNPEATDANCPNKDGSYWYQDQNTFQPTVTKMFSDGLQMVTNTTSDSAAWDAIFHNYNSTHGKGDVGYTAGQKIVIKANFNARNMNNGDINTSPQILYAIINSLVNTVKVAESDIIYGDPAKNTGDAYYNKIHAAFPSVKCYGDGPSKNFWDGTITNPGRTTEVASSTEKITSSEASTAHSTFIPQTYVDASYLIMVPVFKKHHRGGISIGEKLHFGSVTVDAAERKSAENWHFSLPAPLGKGNVTNGKYGSYRCFVDFMGYKNFGGKTILYVVDGIWGSINWGHPAIKWRMAPFNNDYPNSLFLSQDPVAIESVCFDFLFKEFDENHPTEGLNDAADDHGPFPHYAGTDDFLHQAADQANWAAGVTYAPNGDGVALPSSMGTHEHWNNADEKMYSRNLGLNKGIELVSNILTDVKSAKTEKFTGFNSYPNPFVGSVKFTYNLTSSSSINLSIYDLKGALVREIADFDQEAGKHELKWDGLNDNGLNSPAGIYIAKIEIKSNGDFKYQVAKIIKK